MKRNRGRNRRSGGQNPNRHYESTGPDVKIRGSAQQIYEKYQQYARDAQSAGDRVAAENYLQHAEHYGRIVASMQPKDRPGDDADDGDEYDDDMDDGNDAEESVAAPSGGQGAAGYNGNGGNAGNNGNGGGNNNRNRDRDRDKDRGRDRDRDRNRRDRDRAPQPDRKPAVADKPSEVLGVVEDVEVDNTPLEIGSNALAAAAAGGETRDRVRRVRGSYRKRVGSEPGEGDDAGLDDAAGVMAIVSRGVSRKKVDVEPEPDNTDEATAE